MHPELAARVAKAVGLPSLGSSPPGGEGYTHDERALVRLADGRAAFVKGAVDDLTAGWLRQEHRVYAGVQGDFLPGVLSWYDDGARPVLVLEDLSAAHWPPPWSGEQVRRALGTLGRIAETPAPDGIGRLEGLRGDLAGWELVADDPVPFLSLGLCSPTWLDSALPTLLEAAEACVLEGKSLLHFDVRSDNMCFLAGRTVLVDWILVREAPADRLGARDAELVGERPGQIEVATAGNRAALDDLGADFLLTAREDQVDATGQHRMRYPGRPGVELDAAGRLVRVSLGHEDADDRALPLNADAGCGQRLERLLVAGSEREDAERGQQSTGGESRLTLEECRAHAPGERSSRPANDSRTRLSNSAGRDPSAWANWRRLRNR